MFFHQVNLKLCASLEFLPDSPEFAKLRFFRAHLSYVSTCFTCLRAFVPEITLCLHALNYYLPSAYVLSFFTWQPAYMYFFVPTCLRALNYFLPTCAHFTTSYVYTTTQDLGTDINPVDVKPDEN